MKAKSVNIENKSNVAAIVFPQNMNTNLRQQIEHLIKSTFPGLELSSFVEQEDGTFYQRTVELNQNQDKGYTKLAQAVFEYINTNKK